MLPPGDQEVHEAARTDATRLKLILEQDHMLLHARGFMGKTPLHGAVSSDNFDAVTALLNAGADVNALDGYSKQPPIFGGKSRVVLEALEAAGARLDFCTEQGVYAIQNCAAYVRTSEAMRFWLEKNFNINHVPDFAWPVFNGFCAGADWNEESEFQQDLPMLQLLIEHGADINLQDRDRHTALIDSCKNIFVPLTKFLLNAGSAPNLSDRSGWTALHYAVNSKNRELVELLLQHGADPNQQDKHGFTAIDVALQNETCLDRLEPLLIPKPEKPIPTADQVMARLKNIPDFAEEFFAGCNEEEIDKLERHFQVVLPASYRDFLKRTGKGVGDFMVNDHITFEYDYLFGQAQSEEYKERCKLTRYSFVFAQRLGDQHYFFEADGTASDPPVFMFDDSHFERQQVARSIWEFIESYVIDEEIYRGI